MGSIIKTQVVVLGSGPAGYSAAFRCSDLGLKTILIEKHLNLGGVCLNVGCIPSKSLLHVAKIVQEVNSLKEKSIIFEDIKINIERLKEWKRNIIQQLSNGLSILSKKRNIKIINGIGRFKNKKTILVTNEKESILINFEYAIIATGSRSSSLSFINYSDNRIWNSTDALKIQSIPNKMLIIGGGVIGLEMATIYHSFGSKIDIVEYSNQILSEVDEDIINVFKQEVNNKFNLFISTKIIKIDSKTDGIYVTLQDINSNIEIKSYDVVLLAVGRIPNSDDINLNQLNIKKDSFGFICTNKQMKTNISNIYAIGDVSGVPMLAHKGIHEGHIAAEVISGLNYYFNPKVIPSVVYTEPEISWVGLTEKQSKKMKINYEIAIFPWKASGRALTSNSSCGMTKLIFDKKTNKIIGGTVIGSNAGELIGEISLAIEMGCYAEDIELTIHAHPTLYETIGMAAKIYSGSITDLINLKAKKFI